jgi:hypothetical protein
MSQTKERQRRRLLVAPRFQWPIVGKVLVLATLVAAFFTWSLYYLVWKSALQNGHALLISEFHRGEVWYLWGACLLLCLGLSTMIMLMVTRRIAGQVHRFEMSVDQLLAGQNPDPIMTRKDDYFHEFEADLNSCIRSGGQS